MRFLSVAHDYSRPVYRGSLTPILVGREPCKAYSGWGILTPWNRSSFVLPNSGPENYSGVRIYSTFLFYAFAFDSAVSF
jgi:hypothetical protein